jgi:hypothetical protein
MAVTDNGGVLFLLSGASGSGKSTLARAVADRVDDLAVHELGELAETPWQRGAVSWRRDLMEPWLERVVAYEAEGKDVLLTEIVLGEVLAAPSATRVEGFAACLVDCDDDERLRRLRVRDDGRARDPHQLWDHVAWALWLRRHSIDPQTFTGPIRSGDTTWAWERWESWQAGDPRWTTFVLHTTGETVDASANRLAGWISDERQRRTEGRLPLSGRWWDGPAD